MVTTHELYWAAGFLEGEGSFGLCRKQMNVCAAQVQREPLERLQRMFGGNIYECSPSGRGKSRHYQWNAYSSRGAGVAMTLYTLMSPRRQEQIAKALAVWKVAPDRSNAAKTHCRRGHPYEGENGYVLAGKRYCRACKIDHQRLKRSVE